MNRYKNMANRKKMRVVQFGSLIKADMSHAKDTLKLESYQDSIIRVSSEFNPLT